LRGEIAASDLPTLGDVRVNLGSLADIAASQLSALAYPAAVEIAGGVRPRIPRGKLIFDGVVVIAHAAAVIGGVLPFREAPLDVAVHVAVEIDVDVAAIPIDVVPDLVADGEGRAPRKSPRDRAAIDVSSGRRIVVGRIVRIGPRAINDRRVVIRDVDDI